ncbi:hypothetical protein [Borreliella americana]|uniref:hypothetical protein n=1 Tax=Borreliella americana TaxID=478807 RepID=UPI001E525824|nr:hypothetical protein [Borreliella americana]MCD2332740.1 hypothetical protein [Borreliella americana]
MDRKKDIKKLKEEPLDQYGILVFKDLNWIEPPNEIISDNSSKRSKNFRRRIYGILKCY